MSGSMFNYELSDSRSDVSESGSEFKSLLLLFGFRSGPGTPGTPGSSWVTPAPLKLSSRQEFADWLLGPKRASPGLIGEDNVRFLKKASFLRLSRLSRDGVFLSSFFVFFFTFIGVSLIRIGYSPLQIPRMKSNRPFLHYFTLNM